MKKKFLLLLVIFSFLEITSQNINNFSSLRKLYYQERQKSNFKKVKFYGNQFLNKAKEERDTSKIAEGYILLAHGFSGSISITYIDSAIVITKNNPDYLQPAKSYIHKATMCSVVGDYKKAFNAINYANKYAISSGNSGQQSEIKYILSKLKTKIGDYEGSIEVIKSILPQYRKSKTECESCNRGYIIMLWAYAHNLNFLGKVDKAELIYKEAFPLSLKTKDSVAYRKLLLASAITKYYKKEYKSSLDSINKIDTINKHKRLNKDYYNPTNLALNYLYKGKIFFNQNKDSLAILYLKKVDSISLTTNYFHPSTRENYELLINYYKGKNDIKNQLLYIDKLLKTDSILDSNFAVLTKNINTKYTIPKLILEKEKIINTLKKNDSNKTLFLILLLFGLIIIGSFLIWNYKKRKLYQKRINDLGKLRKTSTSESVIDDEVTKDILQKLTEIENSDLFLNQNFNLSLLAKELSTNTTYLSKIINKHKEKSFKQYLVELRINALINKLEKEPILRKHSIEALAASIGYTNASSFTRIFKNYLGESPSSFLKKKYLDRNK